MQHCLNRVINFREVSGWKRFLSHHPGDKLSHFSRTKINFFNFHLLASFIENGSQKKNLFTFHWSFVRHTHPPCNNETFSLSSMGLRFKPQKHACHSIQLKNSVHPNQPRSWNTCHQRREEKRKTFLFVILGNFCVLDVKNLRNDLWDRLQLIIKVWRSFFARAVVWWKVFEVLRIRSSENSKLLSFYSKPWKLFKLKGSKELKIRTL